MLMVVAARSSRHDLIEAMQCVEPLFMFDVYRRRTSKSLYSTELHSGRESLTLMKHEMSLIACQTLYFCGVILVGRPGDNIKSWTGLSVEESIRMTEDIDKWRKYVHGVTNPRIEDG